MLIGLTRTSEASSKICDELTLKLAEKWITQSGGIPTLTITLTLTLTLIIILTLTHDTLGGIHVPLTPLHDRKQSTYARVLSVVRQYGTDQNDGDPATAFYRVFKSSNIRVEQIEVPRHMADSFKGLEVGS
jgi:hypothetical protein